MGPEEMHTVVEDIFLATALEPVMGLIIGMWFFLIKKIAQENRLRGAERIRGELLKLGVRVCKRTISSSETIENRPELGYFSEKPCQRDLGLRFYRGPRLAVSAAQLLREATAWGKAICERFIGGKKRACLDQMLILHQPHLRKVVTKYALYYDRARPHQGIKQHFPARLVQTSPILRQTTARSSVVQCGAVPIIPTPGPSP
jgi:hypothetical protein